MHLDTLHEHAPLIWDWCSHCRLYVAHDNGTVYRHSFPVSATRCCQCARITFYR